MVKYFTYQNMARWNALNGAAWLGMMTWSVDQFAAGCGVEPKLFESAAMQGFLNVMRALVFGMVLNWVAVSLSSDHCIRKTLQYSLPVGPAALSAMFYHRSEIAWAAIQMNLVIITLTTCATLYCLYGAHKPGNTNKHSGNSRMTNSFRFFYINWFAWGVWCLADHSGMFAMFGMAFEGAGSAYMAKLLGFFTLGMSLMGIAHAQCGEDDQKRLLQGSIIGVAGWMVATSLNGDLMMAGPPNMMEGYWAFLVVNVFVCVWAAYPASWKTWLLRLDYINGAATAICLFLNSKMCWKLWKTTEHAPEASAFITGLLTMQVLGQMAAASLPDDLQKKFLQYSMVGKAYFIALCASGKLNMGMGLWWTVATLVLTYLVLYTPNYPAFDMLRENGARGRSPRRSKTPMKKR